MPIEGERLGDAQRLHVGKTFAVDPADGVVGEFGKPIQCGTGYVPVTPTQGEGRTVDDLLGNPGGVGKRRSSSQEGERFGEDAAAGH